MRPAKDLTAAGYIFPGKNPGSPISGDAMAYVLHHQMKRQGLTVHGFRSTFSDWAAETGQPVDLREAALAHALGSKVAQAYARGDLLERRRRLMDAWAAWCG